MKPAVDVRALPTCIAEFDELLRTEYGIDSSLFTREHRAVHLHGHCHQKALASVAPTVRVLINRAPWLVFETIMSDFEIMNVA